MQVNLPIDGDPDAKIIKNLLEVGYNGTSKADVFGFETKDGGTFSFKSAGSEKLIREQFIKPFFEEILMEHGEFACEQELEKILIEIDEGR